MNDNRSEPVLDAPGAGLPKIELIIGNIIVKSKLFFATREASERQFFEELRRIEALVGSVASEALQKRVLIPRLRGMEDSSRYWSILMTLQHLVIVNNGTLGLVKSLVAGSSLTRAVSTADVKPSPDVTHAITQEFLTSSEKFIAELGKLPNIQSTLTWPHPWFGELSAADWHFFAGFHMAIHRKQIEAIIRSI
jgi:hypothetical protein